MRVVGIIDDECAAQPVAILRRQMAVVPERPCIAVRHLDQVVWGVNVPLHTYLPGQARRRRTRRRCQTRSGTASRTPCHLPKRMSVDIGHANAMVIEGRSRPRVSMLHDVYEFGTATHDAGRREHGLVHELVHDVDVKAIALSRRVAKDAREQPHDGQQ